MLLRVEPVFAVFHHRQCRACPMGDIGHGGIGGYTVLFAKEYVGRDVPIEWMRPRIAQIMPGHARSLLRSDWLNGRADVHRAPPRGGFPVVRPVFVQRGDQAALQGKKADGVEGSASIGRENAHHGNGGVPRLLHALDYPVPLAGVIAVCADIFGHAEPLVGAVPAYCRVLVEETRQRRPVLGQDVPPKSMLYFF